MQKIELSLPELELLSWFTEKPMLHRIFTQTSSGYYSTKKDAAIFACELSDGKLTAYEYSTSSYFQLKIPSHILSECGDLFDRVKGTVSETCSSPTLRPFFSGIKPIDQVTEEKRDKVISLRSNFSNPDLLSKRILYVPNASAYEYMEKFGKDQLDELRRLAFESKKDVRRLILIGKPTKIPVDVPEELKSLIPPGFSLPVPRKEYNRIVASAFVCKDTKTRYYIEEINKYSGTTGVIEGSRYNEYIDKNLVILDHADQHQIDRLLEIEKEYLADFSRIMVEELRNIIPIYSAFSSRLEQKLAEYEDMVREVNDVTTNNTP